MIRRSARNAPTVRPMVEVSSESPSPWISSISTIARTPAARIFSPAIPNSSHDGSRARISRARSPPWRSPDASPATIMMRALRAVSFRRSAATAGGASAFKGIEAIVIEIPGAANSPHRQVNYPASIILRVIPADRVANLIDRRTLVGHPLRQQHLARADFARGGMHAPITIEQTLMTFRLVTSAIAVQLRQQRRILPRIFVCFPNRTDELVRVERPGALLRTLRSVCSVCREGLCLRPSCAAAMTRYAHGSARIAIARRRTAEHRRQVRQRDDRRERGAENYCSSHAAPLNRWAKSF